MFTYPFTGRWRIALLSLVVAVIAGGAAAVAGALVSGSLGPGRPVNYAPTSIAIPPLSSDPASDVAAMASSIPGVSAVQLRPTTSNGSAATELDFDVAVPTLDGSSMAKAIWQGAIFVGAVSDRYVASGLPPVAEVGETLVSVDGKQDPIGGGVGNVVHDQGFNTVTPTVKSNIMNRAESLGFVDPSVTTIHGIQDALVITLTSADPAGAVNGLRVNGDALTSLLGEPATDFEGVYLEVRSSDGQPVYIEGTAPRDGAGVTWAQPGSGIEVGHRLGS